MTFRRKWCIIEAVKLFDYTLIFGGLSHTGEFSNGVYPIFLPWLYYTSINWVCQCWIWSLLIFVCFYNFLHLQLCNLILIKNAVLEIQSGKRRSVKLFYENLQRACDERKIPVTNLVAELGLSSGNLSSWKKGNKPWSDTLIKIAERLGVSVNYVRGEVSGYRK